MVLGNGQFDTAYSSFSFYLEPSLAHAVQSRAVSYELCAGSAFLTHLLKRPISLSGHVELGRLPLNCAMRGSWKQARTLDPYSCIFPFQGAEEKQPIS